MNLVDEFDAIQDALRILRSAREVALYRLMDEVRAERGKAYRAMETWRWVANAYDHVLRASRAALGLDRRGDPCLPDWECGGVEPNALRRLTTLAATLGHNEKVRKLNQGGGR